MKPMYYADIYLRISKEDGDKEESESIANQKAMALSYADSLPDVHIHKIRIDDGCSGVDFNRPAFLQMMQDIHAGIVNCVIVKDFSRFGRNYIETGRYIQVLFPNMGIRFIAIGDSYDSAEGQGHINNIIVPFKNMVNDAYCADISAKVRSHLAIKRKKGDFIGAFAVYGYIKDSDNRNRLIVDDFAADVVRDIYMWKLSGMSAISIANRLNEYGILSPMEYKRFLGLRYSTSFKLNHTAKWQAKAVIRILTNEVYAGTLEQGKRTTPSYKVHKLINVPKEQWERAENAHEPIIDVGLFNTVQELIEYDTRALSSGGKARPLSGVIICADCGAAMVHKTNTKNGKHYGYYVCSAHRADKSFCSTHNISSSACENAVLAALKAFVVFDQKEDPAHNQRNEHKLAARLAAKQEEKQRDSSYRTRLCESYSDGIISFDDFISLAADYDAKIIEATAAIGVMENELHTIAAGPKKCHNQHELSREMVVAFVKRVDVHKGHKISVLFRFCGDYAGGNLISEK